MVDSCSTLRNVVPYVMLWNVKFLVPRYGFLCGFQISWQYNDQFALYRKKCVVRLFIVPVSLTRQGCTSLSNPSVQRLLQIKFSGAEKSCRPRWNSLPDLCDSRRDTGRPLYQENQNMGTGWVASCPGKNKGIKSPSLRVWSIKMYQNR